jgi:hypothetical protein
MEVSCTLSDVVEDVGRTLVDAEDGRFEVDGGLKVVVVGQFVRIDEEVGRKRVESMKGARRRRRRKRETRNEG